jgi:ATP synthase protein I
MDGYLEDARRGAFKALGLQFLAALLAGVLGLLIGGVRAGEGALTGGLIVTAANLVLTGGVFGGRASRDPQFFLTRMLMGEMLKLFVTAVLFVVAIVVLKAAFGPMMLGFVAALAAYWIGLLKSSIGQNK